MRTRRLQKIAEALKREISRIIFSELKDPRINLVTVTKTEPSDDLRTAKVYVSVIGDEAKKKSTLNALRHARGYIQSIAGKRLEIRFTPILSFFLDDSVNKSVHLSRLIDETLDGDKTV
ncbi:MAG: ribosome-binding factor A [Planctomycetes bacterium RIFCSPHIGHO2_02_FULL_50_42]|nr:MAG: ribosome-binding factor A [Planctomycetes bacterium GWA2_50_13]OHB89320.1 MAG: ribosome-binding factor A [Planctomycetes bacterium RIFCSPHIGHO2_02_FULL_50_42]OHB92004.1 MAG: ribosome-binding factor A [Planctomycetes bacterium RIFCSPHIGHO2_12_FULL_51_37]OHB96120.1 MAG: ribosome-binding factor A [Planctomycetes bacterium RIFCSPLOWO2_02_FULL_50_16]OHC03669.1 MAG: ribosome-binding factor A [Planctomycetes bacterium RIFCSPLOWO2_12_FULL_50_35]HCN18943.1 30S ribosome-binding factor RbfA [Plan